jgi:hypothetical protein
MDSLDLEADCTDGQHAWAKQYRIGSYVELASLELHDRCRVAENIAPGGGFRAQDSISDLARDGDRRRAPTNLPEPMQETNC